MCNIQHTLQCTVQWISSTGGILWNEKQKKVETHKQDRIDFWFLFEFQQAAETSIWNLNDRIHCDQQ